MTFCTHPSSQGFAATGKALAGMDIHSEGGMTHHRSAERNQASSAPFFSFSQDSILSLLSILIVVPVSKVLPLIILRSLPALKPIL